MTDLAELTVRLDTSPKMYVVIHECMSGHGRVMTLNELKQFLDAYVLEEHHPHESLSISVMR